MEQLFDAILEIAGKNPDGFTVDLTTLKKVTKGISVAYLETQDSFGEEGLKRVLKHALVHEKKVGENRRHANGQNTYKNPHEKACGKSCSGLPEGNLLSSGRTRHIDEVKLPSSHVVHPLSSISACGFQSSSKQ